MGTRSFFRKIKNYIKYRKDLSKYKEQCADNPQFRYERKNKYPILGEWDKDAADLDSHYFFQDLWVARQIGRAGIKHIYDIGSRVDGYIAHLLSMDIEVTMIDVRPLGLKIDGLHFMQGNATSLESIADDSLNALSCLHALEHFGLGRYGDPVDYLGWKKALHAMAGKVKKGGHLYLSVPVGKEEKLMFNAHRIFSPLSIVREVGKTASLDCFALVHKREVMEIPFEHQEDMISVFQNKIMPQMGKYDCGIFVFRKC